eukprot:Skav207909  [mRNA]  locus=scaffold190:184538:187529:- [translate_table: standard]
MAVVHDLLGGSLGAPPGSAVVQNDLVMVHTLQTWPGAGHARTIEPLQLRSVLGAFLFSLGSACYALLGILSQLSKSPDGSYAYSLPSVVLLAEFTKLCISLCFLTADSGSISQAAKDVLGTSLKSWLAFAFPSALYSLNNNLDMLNNQHMDPATEQVLVQVWHHMAATETAG